ncbi:alpha/beta hydrolase [Natronoglycomyces albus]|uniref:Esterase n=1 Tax=Natronoglycomyces albus TaxID=2811108 RepID=A0A895XIR2_9ACTN|nr:alpha/beta hydrolase-fold protein [Natronoglycomyces albus]QSB05224.1 hypothetical protein JQS30_15945 [Natronoglycomyces albus]
MRRPQRPAPARLGTALILAAVACLAACTTGSDEPTITKDHPETSGVEELPELTDTPGITVTDVQRHSDRTFGITYDTPSIHPEATFGGLSVYITLPQGYTASEHDYSTLYLLHGGGDGRAHNWYEHGRVEQAEKDLIMVMPEGGKVGWYTDWIDQETYAQNWMTHHLDELIPFVEANLRTHSERQGRAIAGLSMGGFGAVNYAQERPELFASVSSFSGALDLSNAAVRATITQQSLSHGMPMFGSFGTPFIGPEQRWDENNPVLRAETLENTQVNLYAGEGLRPGDVDLAGIDIQGEALGAEASGVVEWVVAQTTEQLHTALEEAGIEHHYWMYGAPEPDCDGGHNWPCWRFALADALPRIHAVLLD